MIRVILYIEQRHEQGPLTFYWENKNDYLGVMRMKGGNVPSILFLNGGKTQINILRYLSVLDSYTRLDIIVGTIKCKF